MYNAVSPVVVVADSVLWVGNVAEFVNTLEVVRVPLWCVWCVVKLLSVWEVEDVVDRGQDGLLCSVVGGFVEAGLLVVIPGERSPTVPELWAAVSAEASDPVVSPSAWGEDASALLDVFVMGMVSIVTLLKAADVRGMETEGAGEDDNVLWVVMSDEAFVEFPSVIDKVVPVP